MIDHRAQRHLQYVGVNLLPKFRLAAAVGDDNISEVNAYRIEYLYVLAKAKSDRFKNRTKKVFLSVSQVEPEEGAAESRIVNRALLAQKIRQAKNLPWRDLCSGVVELCQVRRRSEMLEPTNEASASRHATVWQPLSGHRMGIKVEPFVDNNRVADREDVARSSQFDEAGSGIGHAR